MNMKTLPLHGLLLVILVAYAYSENDFYQVLGVSKTADSREIRKAFKKLALVLHPDKNTEDKDAQEKFLKLKQAYEVLKDQESRKTYDLYGEKGLKDGFQNNREYQNWHFYEKNFGLYDDDQDIITLSASDFEQNVRNTFDFWFVKFYSPMCSHCHIMASDWRELAADLIAVVKVAAVNCQEEWVLCRNEGITSYPTLVLYPSREKYYGERRSEEMQSYVLHKLPINVMEIFNRKSLQVPLLAPRLLIVCKSSYDSECPSWQARTKLSYLFEGLVSVAHVDCTSADDLCSTFPSQSSTYFLPSGAIDVREEGVEISSLDYLEIASQVLKKLPDAELVDQQTFEALHQKLKDNVGPDWLIYFVEKTSDHENFASLQYRRLPALLPKVKLGRVPCDSSNELCRTFFITKYPTFATLKKGGAIEVYVGGTSVSDIVTFTRNSILAPNLETLTPSTFPSCLNDGHPWLIDFYAPWCPPCRRLIPEFRRASSLVGGIVKFGSLDCSVHRNLCASYNVQSYPTLVFFNNSVPHQYSGQFLSQDIATFVEDVLRPPVVELTVDNFERLVSKRSPDEIWVIDFFAPWCGPCIQLAPQWRRVARMMAPFKNVHVGSVDCVAQGQLCRNQAVNAYPTIRMYPMGKSNSLIKYNGYQRDAISIRNWVLDLLPSMVFSLTDSNFEEVVLKSRVPWVVDFYAPWCGPCQTFGYEFEVASKILEGQVKFAKVNCQNFYQTCQWAAVQAYPSIRFYPGKTASRPIQHPSGTVFRDQKNAESVVSWVEELLSQQSSASNMNSNRDEL